MSPVAPDYRAAKRAGEARLDAVDDLLEGAAVVGSAMEVSERSGSARRSDQHHLGDAARGA